MFFSVRYFNSPFPAAIPLNTEPRSPAVISANKHIKTGVIAMHHSWGVAPEPGADERVREVGANTNKLIDNLTITQPYTGMTQQSAIPVYITKNEAAA